MLPNWFIFLPKWRNFDKSGHTAVTGKSVGKITLAHIQNKNANKSSPTTSGIVLLIYGQCGSQW